MQNRNVMHIEQRFGFEGGIAFKAIDQANGLLIQPGNIAGRAGNARKVFAQACCIVWLEGFAAAHGVLGVGVQQKDQGLCIVRVQIINAPDLQTAHAA